MLCSVSPSRKGRRSLLGGGDHAGGFSRPIRLDTSLFDATARAPHESIDGAAEGSLAGAVSIRAALHAAMVKAPTP